MKMPSPFDAGASGDIQRSPPAVEPLTGQPLTEEPVTGEAGAGPQTTPDQPVPENAPESMGNIEGGAPPDADDPNDISPFLNAAGGGDATRENPLIQPDILFDPDKLAEHAEANKSGAARFIDKIGIGLILAYSTFTLSVLSIGALALFGGVDKEAPPAIQIDPSQIKIVRNNQPAPEDESPDNQDTAQQPSSELLESEIPSPDTTVAQASLGTDEEQTAQQSDIQPEPQPALEPERGTTSISGLEQEPGFEASLDVEDPYKNKLSPVPAQTLIEVTPRGTLPTIGQDGKRPLEQYARPATTPPGHNPIAVVMVNLGQSSNMMELALRLPGAVSLGFVPHAQQLGRWMAEARAGGHEVLLKLPIQPRQYPESDAGPFALNRNIGREENLQRLHSVLGKMAGYTALLIQNDGVFYRSRQQLDPIISDLSKRGVGLVGIEPQRAQGILAMAWEADIPVSDADMYIRTALSRANFIQRLAEAEVAAQTQGDFILFVEALPNNVARIREWSRYLPERQLALAPLSAVILRRHAKGRPAFVPDNDIKVGGVANS